MLRIHAPCTLAVALIVAACGGSNPTPATASSPGTTATPEAPSTTATPPTAQGVSGAAPTVATATPTPSEPAYDDPTESAGPVAMSVELAKGTPKTSFPKKKTDEMSCWQSVSLSGDSSKDYAVLAAACGQPTGLLEYAKPVTGKLHATKDKSDVFTLDLQKGLCYRYIAASDKSIADIDILVEKPGGALVADDKQTGPVAIIEADKTWCMDDDAKYEFHITIDGAGTGQYMFGVWARPKK
jgi:hypothetical protein